jgi:hypothetical protein
MFSFRSDMARVIATVAIFTALSACATAPVDKAQLAQVHSIALEGFAEPDYFLAARAHVGADSYRAIGKMLLDHGYKIVPDRKSADAILAVEFPVATDNGADEIMTGGCTPLMQIEITMKAANGKTIFRRTYAFANKPMAGLGEVLLRVDPKFTVSDCTNSGIMANADLVVAAFKSAVPELAEALGNELTTP